MVPIVKRFIHYRLCVVFVFQRMVMLLAIVSGLQAAVAHAQDPAAFQVKLWAASCMACHGPDGRAEGTGMTIGGQPAQELQGKLIGYKNGKLKGTIMHQHAKGYSDEELARIADYFSSLK